jgi:biotin transport system substrate-specific component
VRDAAVPTRDLVRIALFAAIVAALGLLPALVLPVLPVPVTAQTLGVMLAGSILGARRGAAALLAFLALVALGLPVLAGGRGGLGVFAGPSAGFLLAWPIAAATVGWLTERWWRTYDYKRALAANLIGGIGVVYLCGIPWLAAVADLSLWAAAVGAGVFIPGDIVKALVAAAAAVAVRKSFPVIEAADAGR